MRPMPAAGASAGLATAPAASVTTMPAEVTASTTSSSTGAGSTACAPGSGVVRRGGGAGSSDAVHATTVTTSPTATARRSTCTERRILMSRRCAGAGPVTTGQTLQSCQGWHGCRATKTVTYSHDMTDENLTVLVTGATGFVGRRLVPALIEAGHDVKAMTRRPDEYDGPGKPVGGDVFDAGSLGEPLADVDVAIYLVHSLDDDDFERKDADAARSFALAAAASGVAQIVYLGGLGKDGTEMSAHLRSRREVEELLGASGVPVTVLRAAVVVGAGGISWEMTRQLVRNLPAMVVPKWATTLTQPIGIDDAVRYLVGVTGAEKTYGQVYEIGGADRLTYLEMMQQAAEVMNGDRIPILTVPVLTPGLSSRWIGLVTDVDKTTAANLIDSMGTEVIQTDYSIRDVVPGEPLSYQETVRRALEDGGR